jgi:hypothetical protein
MRRATFIREGPAGLNNLPALPFTFIILPSISNYSKQHCVAFAQNGASCALCA